MRIERRLRLRPRARPALVRPRSLVAAGVSDVFRTRSSFMTVRSTKFATDDPH